MWSTHVTWSRLAPVRSSVLATLKVASGLPVKVPVENWSGCASSGSAPIISTEPAVTVTAPWLANPPITSANSLGVSKVREPLSVMVNRPPRVSILPPGARTASPCTMSREPWALQSPRTAVPHPSTDAPAVKVSPSPVMLSVTVVVPPTSRPPSAINAPTSKLVPTVRLPASVTVAPSASITSAAAVALPRRQVTACRQECRRRARAVGTSVLQFVRIVPTTPIRPSSRRTDPRGVRVVAAGDRLRRRGRDGDEH